MPQGSLAALVTHEPLDVSALLGHLADPGLGGTAAFIGTVRSPNLGRDIAYLEYEGFERMVLSEMRLLADETSGRLAGETGSTLSSGELRVVLAHRLGRVTPGEAAMLIAVAARHRAQALQLCAELVEACKARLPVWKLEVGLDGSGAYAPGMAVAASTL